MNAFEREHVRDIALRNQKISRVIDGAMTDLSKRFQTVKGKRFAKVLNDRFAELREHIKTNTADGVRNQWMLANEKNNAMIDGYLAGVTISKELAQSFRTPNLGALNAFIDRTENGMNLSKRVWRMTNGTKKEIESLISQGVLEGKSARVLSKELKGFVKGKPIRYQGKLIKGANLNYQAIRLAATEMNMAFRTADYLQNSRLPFVTGVTVELSAAHPRDDICDSLQGHYPKGFNFTGWHVLCICFATWDTLPKEEFAKYIETGNIDQRRFTTAIPQRAQRYLEKNGERLIGYKNTPYWLRDNFTDKLVLKDFVQTPIMETAVPMVPKKEDLNPVTMMQTEAEMKASEYKTYLSSMEGKYTKEKMYQAMSDAELDKLTNLEELAYKAKKSTQIVTETTKNYIPTKEYVTPGGNKIPTFADPEEYIEHYFSKPIPENIWLHGSRMDALDLSKNFKQKNMEGYANYLFTTKNPAVAEHYSKSINGFFAVEEKRGIKTFLTRDETVKDRIARQLVDKKLINNIDNLDHYSLVQDTKRWLGVDDVVENSIYDNNAIVKEISKMGYDAIETSKEKIFIKPWESLKIIEKPKLAD